MEIFGFPFPMGEVPEEIRRAHEEAQARSSMEQTEFRNKVRSMMEGMSNDELATFKQLLRMFTDPEQGPKDAIFIIGLTSGLLEYGRGVCGGCGQDHAAELLDDTDPFKDAVSDIKQPGPITDESSPYNPNYQRNLELYGLREPHENEIASSPDEEPVICVNCGMLYQSLHDRMLRPVDGCNGCHLKSAHG